MAKKAKAASGRKASAAKAGSSQAKAKAPAAKAGRAVPVVKLDAKAKPAKGAKAKPVVTAAAKTVTVKKSPDLKPVVVETAISKKASSTKAPNTKVASAKAPTPEGKVDVQAVAPVELTAKPRAPVALASVPKKDAPKAKEPKTKAPTVLKPAADIVVARTEVEANPNINPSMVGRNPLAAGRSRREPEKRSKKGDRDPNAVYIEKGQESVQWALLFEKSKAVKPVPYKMTDVFEPKTPIQHKTLGWGYVLSNQNDRLEVLFEVGIKMLISNYKG